MEDYVRIECLTVLQNGLRNVGQLDKMVEFVKAGGRFDDNALLCYHVLMNTGRERKPARIHLAFMEDGKTLLHDGHHRALAIFLGGRNRLYRSEYDLKYYTYFEYENVSVKRDWFTPLNVDTHVRKPEFWGFKKMIKEKAGELDFPGLRDLINSNKELYLEKRKVNTIEEFANGLQETVDLCRMRCRP